MPRKRESQYADSGALATDYDWYVSTQDHHRCLWNDHGERCMNAATRLTTVLATKTKQLPGGPHLCVIKGGYCAQHIHAWEEGAEKDDSQIRGRKDWRDVLMDAELRARGVAP